MKLLIVCVGEWIEPWSSLIKEVSAIEGIQLTVATCNCKGTGLKRLQMIKEEYLSTEIYNLSGLPMGVFTGHAATSLFGLSYIQLIKRGFDVIHIIGEASYLCVLQFILARNKFSSKTKISIRAAQNVLHHFPWPFPYIERYSFNNVSCIFPVSNDAENVVRKKGYNGKATVVPNGFDPELFEVKNTDELKDELQLHEFVIGYVGNFSKQKGIYTLLDAVNKLSKAQYQLLMIGSGEEKANFRQRVIDLGLEAKVLLIDKVEQIKLPEYMNCMDVLVLPSYESKYAGSPLAKIFPSLKVPWAEQFGRVLVEAMACGVPVIGSDSGSIPDVVGEAGLIFKAKNVDDLTEKLKIMISDYELRQRFRKNGLHRAAQKFSWGKIATEFYCVWESLVRGGVT